MAQIVRDFMEAAARWVEVTEGLRAGALDFSEMQRLVGEAEDSVLFRLKEQCHALFRVRDGRPSIEVEAEELFDLVVGALFHETMKLREGFYLTATYTPRLERMTEEVAGGEPLRKALGGLLDAGRRRVEESTLEVDDLIHETREQLLIVLRQLADSGPVARCLVEDPQRTEQVFQMDLESLLADVYGDAGRGLELALGSLLQSGHFDAAVEILDRHTLPEPAASSTRPWAAAMAAYYAGAFECAVDLLGDWLPDDATGRVQAARRTLLELARTVENETPALARRARELAGAMTG